MLPITPVSILPPKKLCTKCSIIKEAAAFYSNKKLRSGLNSWCKDCHNNRRKNPAFKDKMNKAKRRRIDANPDKYLEKILKAKFDIDLKYFNTILLKQNSVCAICKKFQTTRDPRRGKLRRLSVDHCHKSGRVRGLLCDRCNTSLGKFEDSIELLQSAILYLQQV